MRYTYLIYLGYQKLDGYEHYYNETQKIKYLSKNKTNFMMYGDLDT